MTRSNGRDANLQKAGDRIEQLVDDLATRADPRVFAETQELLRLVIELYGSALERAVELASEIDDAARRRFADDELLGSLMMVHGLHPDSLEVRLERALASVRPTLAAHGGDVELLDIDVDAGAVLLRLLGSCDGCPSSAITLRSAVETAIVEAAPEIGIIDVEEPTPEVAIRLGVKPVYESCPAEVPA